MERFKKDCVADTSSLIALAKGNAINCLGELFSKVYIPQAVKEECQEPLLQVASRNWHGETGQGRCDQ